MSAEPILIDQGRASITQRIASRRSSSVGSGISKSRFPMRSSPFNDPAAQRPRSARSADAVRCSRELNGESSRHQV
jgi:hypothetical protein